ncbi:PREDICTED: intercellular adhesion molecule 2 [Galeopterus variegatus]|uniref:Intercellular adhesion molecule 2 n=1 Tax=Galeopterus variegatus TaxID=482537 RepID=A0ABM0R9K1_GALVR|nr:PREDICTED: intercellular adhesion molecule 2 [Galeopterus variegatus]
MSPFGCWSLPMTLLTLLCCPGSEKAFEVYTQPEKLAVETMGSQKVNCSTSCPQPKMGGLETMLTKTLLDQQLQWKLYLISNVSEDTVLYCHFNCSGEQKMKGLPVSVYKLPKKVSLKLQPTWVTVGKSFTIECSVLGVEPLENLTIFLFHGKEALHNQTFGRTTPAPQEVMATLNSTAHRDDSLHNFSCQAQLDLRSRGGDIFYNISEPQVLEIHEPMQDSWMVIIITVVLILLFLFVTSILFCFAFSQHWYKNRTGNYGVRAAWRRLQAFRPQPA